MGDIDPQGELVSMHTNTLANLLLLTGIKDAATLFSIVLRMGVLYTYMCTLKSGSTTGIHLYLVRATPRTNLKSWVPVGI